MQFFHIGKAFAGYPLIHNDRVIGVLALFSKKKLNTADFELLVYLYFCAFNTEYW
jgi:GAF domain-containing protein